MTSYKFDKRVINLEKYDNDPECDFPSNRVGALVAALSNFTASDRNPLAVPDKLEDLFSLTS